MDRNVEVRSMQVSWTVRSLAQNESFELGNTTGMNTHLTSLPTGSGRKYLNCAKICGKTSPVKTAA